MGMLFFFLCLMECLCQVINAQNQYSHQEDWLSKHLEGRRNSDFSGSKGNDMVVTFRPKRNLELRASLLKRNLSPLIEKEDAGEYENIKLRYREYDQNYSDLYETMDDDLFSSDSKVKNSSVQLLPRNQPKKLEAKNRPTSPQKPRGRSNKKKAHRKNTGKKGSNNKDLKYWNNVLDNIDEGVQVGKNLINSVQSGDVKQAVGSVLDVAQFATGLAGMIPGPIGAGFQAVSGVVSFFGGLFGPKTTTVNPLDVVNEKLDDLGETVGEVNKKVNEMDVKIDEVGENVKQIDKKINIIDTKLDDMDDKMDNMTVQLEEITEKLVQVSDKLMEMTNTLENVLNAVNQTQYIVKEEVRGINVKEMSTQLSAADDLFKRMLRSKSRNTVDQFVRHCDKVENYPEIFKNIIVKDTYGLKALIANEEYGYDKKKYADFAVNTIRLFYHAAHISAICSSTRNIHASEEEKEDLRLEAENNAQSLMTEIAETIENDTIIPFRRLIEDETEKHSSSNKYRLLSKNLMFNFSSTVEDRLANVFPDAKTIFISWVDPLNKFKNIFYPFNGNEKTVKLLTDQATDKRKPSFSNKYIHYWLGKWDRNMLFYYNSANDNPTESWTKDVRKCSESVQYKFRTEFGEPTVNCHILFQEMKECLEEQNTPFGSLVCISGRLLGSLSILNGQAGLAFQLFEPVSFDFYHCVNLFEESCHLRLGVVLVFPK